MKSPIILGFLIYLAFTSSYAQARSCEDVRGATDGFKRLYEDYKEKELKRQKFGFSLQEEAEQELLNILGIESVQSTMTTILNSLVEENTASIEELKSLISERVSHFGRKTWINGTAHRIFPDGKQVPWFSGNEFFRSLDKGEEEFNENYISPLVGSLSQSFKQQAKELVSSSVNRDDFSIHEDPKSLMFRFTKPDIIVSEYQERYLIFFSRNKKVETEVERLEAAIHLDYHGTDSLRLCTILPHHTMMNRGLNDNAVCFYHDLFTGLTSTVSSFSSDSPRTVFNQVSTLDPKDFHGYLVENHFDRNELEACNIK